MTTARKEFVRKPDFVMRGAASLIQFVKDHSKECIIGIIILFLAAAASFAYTLHQQNRDDAVQYQLSTAISAFDSYSAKGSKEDLEKAEKLFNEIVGKKRGQSQYVAKLYLAKLSYMRGDSQNAKKYYEEVAKYTSSTSLKAIAEGAISHIDKK